jgi:hypothetical protein
MFMLMEANKKSDDISDGEKTEDPKVADAQKTDTGDDADTTNDKKDKGTENDDSGNDLFADVDHQSDMGTGGEGLDTPDTNDESDTTNSNDDGVVTNTDDEGDGTSTDEDMNNDTEETHVVDDTSKTKSQKLFSDYYDLFTNVNDMVSLLSNISELNSLEYTTVTRTIDNLKELSFSINTYMMNRFNTKTYEENLAMYYKMVNSVKITDKIISKIIENRNKG